MWTDSQIIRDEQESREEEPLGSVVRIDPLKDPRWDRFVENHPFGWICHSSGWKRVLEQTFKHIKGHHLALVDSRNGNIKAGLPLFEVCSWLTGRRLVSIPFATLSDPLISSPIEMKTLLDAAIDLSDQIGTSRIEIRTLYAHPLISDPRLAGDHFYKHHYLKLDKKPEELRRSFHRKAVRQEINMVEKSNLRLRIAGPESDLRKFYILYVKTRKRLGLPPHPYRFFKALWDVFYPSGKIALFLAELDKDTIAGHMVFKFNQRFSAEFEGWDKRFSKMSPNHFLFWEEIKAAYSEGYKIFDFGRTSPGNIPLMDFKRHWGTHTVDLPQFFYPMQSCGKVAAKESSLAYKLIQGAVKNSPDFALSAIGKFCYRHLG